LINVYSRIKFSEAYAGTMYNNRFTMSDLIKRFVKNINISIYARTGKLFVKPCAMMLEIYPRSRMERELTALING